MTILTPEISQFRLPRYGIKMYWVVAVPPGKTAHVEYWDTEKRKWLLMKKLANPNPEEAWLSSESGPWKGYFHEHVVYEEGETPRATEQGSPY